MSEQTTQNTKLILIVDDDEDTRILLSDFLQDEGHNIICAEESSTAIIQAKDHHPDLILMDISLPGINGWQTVQYLRNMPEFCSTPIIAVTAHATKEEAEHSLTVGCNAHVSKPFDLEEILKQIVSLLQENTVGEAKIDAQIHQSHS